ncbi:hypothetical protein N7470_000029 [Penicillium chermesinum]|nr:hypothetical protein N7470_000029 [Penicillium chermesinum]
MSTNGRLTRVFPGPTLIFDSGVFYEQDLRKMVTQTVVRMSEQTVAGTKPKAKKANQEHDEDRDTTDPKVVVDFFHKHPPTAVY